MAKFLGMIGGLIPSLAGLYFGMMFVQLIDLYVLGVWAALIAVCWWLASKTLKSEFKNIVPVVGAACGQLAAVVISAISLLAYGHSYGHIGENWAEAFVDSVVLLIGVIWLIKRPGRAPVVLLIIYEVIDLLLKSAVAFSSEMAPAIVHALIPGILLNLFALIVLSIALATKSTMTEQTVTLRARMQDRADHHVPRN